MEPDDDIEALRRFGEAVDVVTFEFENIPHESVQLLSEYAVVRPGWKSLAVAQDRLVEKEFINKIAETTPFRPVTSPAELEAAAGEIGRPAVLKTARMGYDGKGQVLIAPDCDYQSAWDEMGADIGILEAFVDLAREISVIVARSPGGGWATYPPVENRHVNHILDTTIAPAVMSPEMAREAVDIAHAIADGLDYDRLCMGGRNVRYLGGGLLLVNEIAPRVAQFRTLDRWHACTDSASSSSTSAPSPLCRSGDTVTPHHDAEMKNLIGSAARGWADLMSDAGARLHLYGKKEIREGRKMGHVNRLYPRGHWK